MLNCRERDHGWRRGTNVALSQAILGSKFWASGDLNQNLKKTFCRGGHGEVTAKKWLDSIEKQKRRIDLKFVRDKHTDR